MHNYGPRLPRKRVKILEDIDVSHRQRYKQATLIYVTDGRGDLCRKGSKGRYRVMLESKPLCEIHQINETPSIAPWLKETESEGVLLYVKEAFQRHMSLRFRDYVEIAIPLFACLENGYYLILDALLYPATGNRDFFYEIDRETTLEALIDPDGLRPSPAYIYPTAQMQPYMERIKPRITDMAISYYLQGYTSLLLAGHELAVTAAMNGEFLRSMVIVPCTQSSADGAWFADLFVPMENPPEPQKVIPTKLMQTKNTGHRIDENHCDLKYRHLWQQYPLMEPRGGLTSWRLKKTVLPIVKLERFRGFSKHKRYKGIVAAHIQYGTKELAKVGHDDFYKLVYKDVPLVQVHGFWGDGRTHISPAYSFAEDSREIQQAVSNIADTKSNDIVSCAEALFPLLGMLPDGDYAIVDTTLYPSTGEGFFWSVANAPVSFLAAEEPALGYPCPAYIYPTMHPGCYKDDTDEVARYAYMLERGTGKAIAYYLEGAMCALLYGHTMAAIAAASHKELPALVIIPYSGLVASNSREILGRFADIVMPIRDIKTAEAGKMIKSEVEYQRHPIIGPAKGWEAGYLDSWKSYPSPEQLMTNAD